MELELIENKGTVFIGDKLVVKTKLKFEEDTSNKSKRIKITTN